MIDLPVYQSRIRNLGNDKSLAEFVLAFPFVLPQILDFASNILRSSYLLFFNNYLGYSVAKRLQF